MGRLMFTAPVAARLLLDNDVRILMLRRYNTGYEEATTAWS